uniref:Uncharacterized protein n=1 Tax=Panagrolaimus davidi TaxID=227884 RepID=A0A914QQM8_9BILA
MGSAGKSTIIRHYFILHLKYLCATNSNYKYCNEDWSEKKDEIEGDDEIWKNKIRENIINAFDIFIKQVYKNGDKFENEELQVFAKSLEHLYANKSEIPSVEMSDLFREHLINLLNDPSFKKALALKNKIQIDEPERKPFDGLAYFLNETKLKEVFYTSYIPSEEDKIYSRLPTIEVHRYYFMLNKTKIEIYDAGGQASERVRLLSYLSRWNTGQNSSSNNRSFILFVVSLSDYNVKHPEYPDKTLLDESAAFMDALLNSEHTRHCGVLIFFNKKDRFFEKITDELCRDDVDYIKDGLSPAELRDYKLNGKFKKDKMFDAVELKFFKLLEEKHKNKSSYSRNTCAVDPKIMETFHDVIKNEILLENISGILP